MVGNHQEIDQHTHPHQVLLGNRPSNSILMPKLTPYNLGMLIALYEHKIFTQGIIWDINSFDQWGVNLAKSQAKNMLSQLQHETLIDDGQYDSSTHGLLQIAQQYLDETDK